MRNPNTQHAGLVADADFIAANKRAPTGAAATKTAAVAQAREVALFALRAGMAFALGAPVAAFVEGYSVAIACMVAPFACAALAFVARKVAA